MTDLWTPPVVAERGRSLAARDAAAGALTAVVLVLLGAPAGLLWARFAPHVSVVLSAGGPGLDDPETSAFVDADVTFGVLCLVAGLLCGVLAFLLARRYGPGVALGLLAGGLLAAWVAKQTGEQVGLDAFRQAVHDSAARGRVDAALRLRAVELVVAWPIGGLLAFAGMTAFVGRTSEPAVSSG